MDLVTLSDFEELAKTKLPKNIFDFIDSGACDELTKHNNKRAFNNISLRPLCLRDVSDVESSVNLLNRVISAPILFAPTAFHQLVDKYAEISTAKASKRCDVPMVVSSMSNISLEDISIGSRNNNLWLQIYIFKDRGLTKQLVQRAEKIGYDALLVTVGTPIMGKRDRDIRNKFSLPNGLSTGNFESTINNQTIYNFTAEQLDPSLTWHDIEWLQASTKLPVILKGILNPLDAEEACRLKVAGIVVSNHGGRQLDSAEATISVLPDINERVAGRTMMLLDGGILRGTDIFKSIALGADAILLGRPILWALAVDGENGVVNMVNILKKEFETTMKLSGCRNIQEIKQFGKLIISRA